MARKSTPNTTSTKGAPKGKGENGPGKSRPIKTSAEQDEIRRAAKRRPRKAMGLHRETMTGGIQQDRINRYAELLLEELDTKMTSGARMAHIIIRGQFVIFMETFVNVSDEQLRQRKVYRTEYALERALHGIVDEPIKRYFATTVRAADRNARHSLRSVA